MPPLRPGGSAAWAAPPNKKKYYLGSDIGVTNLLGQQATISGCVDRELEQHLYNLISDNTPVCMPEPNEDEVTFSMDIITDWIAERHPLDSRCMELFKLLQERGESMVQYSNWILDIADECDLNDITQQEIMAMVFITHCRSPQFRKELRRHRVGITWQFIRKEAQGWDRSQRCEEQSNDKAYTVKRNTSNAQNRSQARNQRPNHASSKKEKADAFFQGKCRRCGSTVHTLKDCKVAADVECRNCNKAGHLAKICASHIFSPLTAEQQRRRRICLLYTSPSPRDRQKSRMPSSA